MPRKCGAPHGGAALLRRTSVFAKGENLGAGAIHLPRADEIIGVPARRKPGGAAHAAQNAEALFCHFTFSMHEAYQPT